MPHKRVHDLFIKKIELYRERFEMGHTIEAELQEILAKWLINHIQHEPYRVCRRVNILRDYPDDKTKLYPRN